MTGLDPVLRFVEIARERDPVSRYIQGMAEELPFEENAFDIVLSYLTVIDIPDLEAACREIARVLKPGGQLHIVTISNMTSSTPGWERDEDGKKMYRKVDRYMEHFAMDLEWREIRIRNYHRPLSYLLGLLFGEGLVMTGFLEPLPPEEDPHYAEEMRVPNFQIYCFRKEGTGL